MTTDEIEKQIKNNSISSLYLFYGEETFIIDTVIKKIKKSFPNLLSGINYIAIDETSVATLIDNIETPAFGFDKKLIIVKNSELFKKEVKNKKISNANIELQQKIKTYIEENYENFKDNVVLIFYESDVGTNDLYKVIEELGVVCNCEKQKPIDVKKRLKTICNAYKVNIDEQTLNYFIEVCGLDLQILINEIRKLIEFVQENGEITNQTIDLLAIKQMDSIIFDLTDSLGQKNIKEALQVLNNLLYAKEPIQKIFVTLYGHFKKLYIVKLAQKYRRDIAQTLGLKPTQTFILSKYRKQSDYFKEQDLKKILKELIKLDNNFKDGLIDLNLGLEAILCTYCS